MLDVHAPEHPIHGIRDFFIHLLTITIELLIALGLENLVEWRHHAHLKHEAEVKIRQEIEGNRKDLRDVLAAVPAEQARYKNLLAFLDAHIAGSHADIRSINIGVKMMEPTDASWQTAAATGALAYMDYDEVQRFAAVYQLQKKMDGVQDATMQPLILLIGTLSSTDLAKMSKEDAVTAARQVREAVGHVETVQEIGIDLEKLYGQALKGK